MKTGYLLNRITYLKTMGSLIQASLEHGHEVFIFYIPNALKGAKAYQNASGEMLQPIEKLGAEIIEIGMEELSNLRGRFGIDVLCMQEAFYNFENSLDILKEVRDSGVRLVSLAHFFEIAQKPLAALKPIDKTFYISDFARKLHVELQGSEGGQSELMGSGADRWAATGSPMFDQIGTVSREEAGRELNFPSDRKIVVLIDPVIAPTTPWRFHVWRDASRLSRARDAMLAGKFSWIAEIFFGNTFREIALEIRQFCDRQNAFLVVKSRGKQANSPYLSSIADVYIDGLEDEYFPVFSTYKVLAAADMCITVNSMAAPEAVAAGVPCVNIYVPHHDRAAVSSPERTKYEDALLSGAPDSLMNYLGCIWKVDRRNARTWFKDHDLADVKIDPQRQKEYVAKYLGIGEESASQRILAELESL
jgi:hypothetical protein